MKLEDFAEIYINTALNLAEENLDSGLFDKRLLETVSKITKISKEKIARIHHPFYWVLFGENIQLKSGSMPMEYVLENSVLLRLDDSKVSLETRLKNDAERKNVIAKVILEYKEYIQSNVRCFQ
jgi:hypothetical protein